VTRVVPVPADHQPPGATGFGPPRSPIRARRSRSADRRKHRRYTARARVAWTRLCPNQLVDDKIAGVPVRIVTPDGMPEANKDKVL
jgi:epsilon-lactone hydrolase